MYLEGTMRMQRSGWSASRSCSVNRLMDRRQLLKQQRRLFSLLSVHHVSKHHAHAEELLECLKEEAAACGAPVAAQASASAGPTESD